MKLFLAGIQRYSPLVAEFKPKYILESFAYIKQKEFEKWSFDSFLLDSGAFTFLSKGNMDINWREYVKNYAAFINQNRIEQFFELDIYKIIGISATEDLRKFLEDLTGRTSIPVWHRHLGLDYFRRLVGDYDYVGIGGFALKNILPNEYKFIPKLLDIARVNGCRVHGLGFTNQDELKRCNFYSVDSTVWNGGRFGTLFVFRNGRIEYLRQPSKRIKATEAARHNFGEWVKFQQWADIYL